MNNSGTPLHKFPRHVQDQIAAQLHAGLKKVSENQTAMIDKILIDAATGSDATRLRQKSGPVLNKTEAAFEYEIRFRHKDQKALVQSVTLLLANGCRYTPDFFVPCTFAAGDGLNCAPVAYEVKGFMRDDAAVKIKVAARAYPWIRFFLATKRKKKAGGGWAIQEILP